MLSAAAAGTVGARLLKVVAHTTEPEPSMPGAKRVNSHHMRRAGARGNCINELPSKWREVSLLTMISANDCTCCTGSEELYASEIMSAILLSCVSICSCSCVERSSGVGDWAGQTRCMPPAEKGEALTAAIDRTRDFSARQRGQ